MRLFKLILFSFFLLLWNNAYNQTSKPLIIIGKAADKTTFLPVFNVNVINTLTKKGVVSDKNGLFTLKTTQQATTIKISHISYNTYSLKITNEKLSKLKNDTLFVSVLLTPKQVQLESFEIGAKATAELAYKRGGKIIDYELYGNNSLFLSKEKGRLNIGLVNELDSSIYEKKITSKTGFFKRDCFGNTQLIRAKF